ncbi:hypothetical protein DYU11_18550 [Fibrisoma montanum]|uniref:Uncharacterized protein n=1 Tax=Fibrisoma montanum TaxID=2305895 RepID=A0A418M657_9BACT|nr:hypothetical protein [Fibrisoma montanum]RIV21407.1 hypothetical protein DYU11_18550 [Fibrisoma montanum]
MYKLIVNHSGLLSACPTNRQYLSGGYIGEPHMKVFSVSIDNATYNDLYTNRDRAYVLGDGLPAMQELPGRVYYQVEVGVLTKV